MYIDNRDFRDYALIALGFTGSDALHMWAGWYCGVKYYYTTRKGG